MNPHDYPGTAWIEYATMDDLFNFLTKSRDDLSVDETRGILIAIVKQLQSKSHSDERK